MEFSTYTEHGLDIFTIIHGILSQEGKYTDHIDRMFNIDGKHVKLKKLSFDIKYIIANKPFYVENIKIKNNDDRKFVIRQFIGDGKKYVNDNVELYLIEDCKIFTTSTIITREYKLKPIPLLIISFKAKIIATIDDNGIEKIKSRMISAGEEVYKKLKS
jgi:hypothetical protein